MISHDPITLIKKEVQRKILLNPGPATTSSTVKQALVVPDICPREQEFGDIMRAVCRGLVDVVHGEDQYAAVLFGGSGTAVMDAAVNSVVAPGKKLAVINNGAYGERLVNIARAYQIPCVNLQYPNNKPLDTGEIDARLAEIDGLGALAMVHHETTTGLLNQLEPVGGLAKKYHCVYIVDAISSYGGLPIDIAESNIDFLLGTSNKCIQGMAGIGFIICRKSELEKLASYPPRSFYLNLWQQYAGFSRTGEMPFTPPVQIIYALRQAISEYFDEGEQRRYQRYTESWRTLRQGLADMGFSFLLAPEHESHILTTVIEPRHPNYDFKIMHDRLFEQGYTIYPGKIQQQNTFRLSVLGDIDKDDIFGFLAVLKKVVTRMGIELPMKNEAW